MKDTRLIKKIRAMLARADADRNDNEYEREIALRQANALMEKYQISITEVNETPDQRDCHIIKFKQTEIWHNAIFTTIGKLYGAVILRSPSNIFVVGKLHERVVTSLMGEYVVNSIQRETKEWSHKNNDFLDSFKLGACVGVYEQVIKILEERKIKTYEAVDNSKSLAIIEYYTNEEIENNNWLAKLGVEATEAVEGIYKDEQAFIKGWQYGESMSLNTQIEKEKHERIK